MSAKFGLVKSYYASGVWSAYRVAMAVEKGWITEDEYKEITGSDYSNDTIAASSAN